MTSNDKTRQKLVDSMRMTKGAANKKTAASGPKVTTKTPDERRHVKVNKNINRTADKTVQEVVVDPYQSKGRIWPD